MCEMIYNLALEKVICCKEKTAEEIFRRFIYHLWINS